MVLRHPSRLLRILVKAPQDDLSVQNIYYLLDCYNLIMDK